MTDAAPRRRFWRRRRFWAGVLVALLMLAVGVMFGLGRLAEQMLVAGDDSGLVRETETAMLPDGAAVAVSAVRTPASLVTDPDARPIIYVHGTPGDALNWERFLRDPVGGAPSIAIDRPGFGRSTPRAVTSFADQAAALRPWLVDRPILVGHSLGGPIIARAVADDPDAVGALVIVAGSLDPELEQLKWYNEAMDLAAVRLFFPEALRVSNDEVMAAKAETAALAEVLDRVRCPVVIVHGTRDSLVPYANVAYMERSFVNASRVETHTLTGADHFIIWSHIPSVRDAIEQAARLASERPPVADQ